MGPVASALNSNSDGIAANELQDIYVITEPTFYIVEWLIQDRIHHDASLPSFCRFRAQSMQPEEP